MKLLWRRVVSVFSDNEQWRAISRLVYLVLLITVSIYTLVQGKNISDMLLWLIKLFGPMLGAKYGR